MKIVIFVDKYGTAIDRLANMVRDNNLHHDIRVHAVHPKRNDAETLHEAVSLMEWADVIDVHYWKSGEVVRSAFAMQWDKKPKILFHFNPYDLDKAPWANMYDMVVVGNKEMYSALPYAHHIPYAVDLGFFDFSGEYVDRENKAVNMVVGRIEGKKGVLEVAEACKALGYPLKLVGRVSNGEYMQRVLGTGVVEFYEDASDEQMREIYKSSAVHVCNSVDGFESGTLPIMEAMACGLPVMTRNVGHIPDISNGANMFVRVGASDDVESLTKSLKEVMENYDWRLKMRDKAFDTIRNYDSRRMASRVIKLYKKLYLPSRQMASIIIPTKDNPQSFADVLVATVNQDYEKKEIIVVDSGEISVSPLIEAVKKQSEVPIKYIHFQHRNTYTLAEARNRGVVEAEGDFLVFCDDRIKMEPNAVTEFANYMKSKAWLWGVKDGVAKGFVENFSAIMRRDLIDGGMFCERMQWYGGMSQEIRTRFETQLGFDFLLIDSAQAKGIKRSKSKQSRRKDIIEAKYLVYKLYGD